MHKDPEDESDVYDVLFNDKGKLLAVSYYGGRLRTYPLDDTFAQHWQQINDYFPIDVEITITNRNEETGQWQLHVASDVDMGSDYRYTAKTGEVSLLLQQEMMIKPALLSKRQSISYQARDGVSIQAYLTLPKCQTKNLPTINKLAYIMAMEQFFAKHLGGNVGERVMPTLAEHLDTLKVDVSRL